MFLGSFFLSFSCTWLGVGLALGLKQPHRGEQVLI